MSIAPGLVDAYVEHSKQEEAAEREAARDKALDALLTSVARYVAEAQTNPAFCGTVVGEIRDASGRLLGVRLVACDLVGGEPARRIGIKS